MYKQHKDYMHFFCGALLVAVGCAHAMAPVTRADQFLAFLAGGHGRVGVNSPVQFLDQHLAEGICKLLLPEKEVVVISEDEIQLSVQLRQPEIPFNRQVILGPSSMHPRRETNKPVRRQMQLTPIRLHFSGQQQQAADVQPIKDSRPNVHSQQVQEADVKPIKVPLPPSKKTLTMPIGNFQVTVSNMEGDMRKVCSLAVLLHISELRVSQRSIIPVDINKQRMQAVPLQQVAVPVNEF